MCPELEKELLACRKQGSNSRRLVLLGIEIVVQPEQPKPAPAPAPVQSIAPPADPKVTASELKERLAAKHKVSGWNIWTRRKRAIESKPLPLPG